MSTAEATALDELATAHGIQLAYLDVDDARQIASQDAVLAALRALGVAIADPADAGLHLDEHRRQRWGRMLEPVVASFAPTVEVGLRLPVKLADQRARCDLRLESGDRHRWEVELAGTPLRHASVVDGDEYVLRGIEVRDLPIGYHELNVEVGAEQGATLIIVAPPRAYTPTDRERAWGVFLPLYALRTARDQGAGDLTDLESLAEWTRGHGAAIVGTLPLLPVYLGDRSEPFDPSPYSPVSRLFWNEVVIDPSRSPELERCPEAHELLGAGARGAAPAGGRRYVDWAEVGRRRRPPLEALARCFFARVDDRRTDLDRFLDERPHADAYARFRAAAVRHGAAWWEWDDDVAGLDDGVIDTDAYRMHVYAQLLAAEQVEGLSRRLRGHGQHPYLDLPVGTRPDGFDVFRFAPVFARAAETGAPPDAIFTGGQNWRFPPLHPERVREDRYRYPIAVLRHHLALADELRIDHVMGLHRLFWIPEGVDAADGLYVSYPADEWYAVLLIESHRHRSRIIGENLGTVPTFVEEALQARSIVRMYVVQYEADPDRYEVLEEIPADTMASVNTHDMPPFARWWAGADAADGVDLGLADERDAEHVRQERAVIRDHLCSLLRDAGLLSEEGAHDPREVLGALLAWLGGSAAPIVLVNLEDLWLETETQNVPGTIEERPNWRRRSAKTLEEMRADREIGRILARLDDARRGRDA